MMAVDASAILAVLLKEPDARVFEDKLLSVGRGVMFPVNHWEVLVRSWSVFGAAGPDAADRMLERFGVDVVPMTAEDSRVAARAFERFGKRAGGRLNLADCFAYALAAKEGEGLLYKGDDFPKTDVVSAFD